MQKKTTGKHGGARKGAGRKPKYPTKVMRVPEALVKKVKDMIRKYNDQSKNILK